MSDPWRHRCPEGHTALKRYGEDYYCQSCDQVYDHLVDAKTGRVVTGGTRA